MSTPFTLFFISMGIIWGIYAGLKGATLATLPSGWFFAEDSDYYLEIWLGACLVFGILLIVNLRVYGKNDRNSKAGH